MIFRRPAPVLLALVLLLISLPATAQSSNPRVKIGVALSGGGALGLAHIGVIKYFEEHHIAIDYIAGTSMGGLVAGFYATGMNSPEMESVVYRNPWSVYLDTTQQFSDLPIVHKQSWTMATSSLEVQLGEKFSLPAGLNNGHELDLMLSRYTAPYTDLKNFDELPTPFRCVATDLVNKAPIVLESGSLPLALRATMSIPGMFTPVQMNGTVMVDGGVLMNLPTSVVRDMGANEVVAVVLNTAEPKANEYASLNAVLKQTVSILISENERRDAAKADLVIQVELGNLKATDYEKSREMVRKGYEAAAAKSKELAAYELSDEDWQKYIEYRKSKTRPRSEQGRVTAIIAQPAIQENASHEIHNKTGGDVVSRERLEDMLRGVVAATGVTGALYDQQPDEGGDSFRVKLLSRTGATTFIHPSFFVGISTGEPSRGALKIQTTFIPRDTYKSRVLAAMNLGYEPGIRTEYYHPFGGTGYFVAPGFFAERTSNLMYSVDSFQDIRRNRVGGSLYAGIGTWRFAQVRLGARFGEDWYESNVASSIAPAHSTGFGEPEIVWIYNTQDSASLPSRGAQVEGSLGYSFRNTPFPYFKNHFRIFHPLQPHIVLFGGSDLATSFGKELSYFNQFTYGGAQELSAYRYQEFRSDSFISALGGAVLSGPSVMGVVPRLALWQQTARLDLSLGGWQTHQSSSVGLLFPTRIGTAGLVLSFNEDGKARFRMMLGNF